MSDLVQNVPFQEIAEKGAALYAKIRVEYEPKDNGKFLAIEPDAGKVYVGMTSVDALEKARAENPGKFFYVVKIGFDSAETLSQTLLGA